MDLKQLQRQLQDALAKRKVWLPLAILGVGILGYLLLVLTKPQADVEPQSEKAWPVAVQIAKPGTYAPELVLFGVVESPRTTKMEAAITADVVATPAKEGLTVNKGDVLIKLDDRDVKFARDQDEAGVANMKAAIKAELARFETDKKALEHEQALYDLAKRRVGRQEHLIKKQFGAEQALDESKELLRSRALAVTNRQLAVDDHINRLAKLQADLKKAEADLNMAKIDVERSQIRAPFDGKVTEVYVAVGDRVRPGDELVQLFDTADVEVNAQIPPEYIGRARQAIAEGREVLATATIDGQQVKLRLDRLDANIDKGRAGIDCMFHIMGDAGKHISLGTTTALRIQLPKRSDLYAVPIKAIYGNDRIYIIDKGRLQAVTIERVGNMTEDDKKIALIASPTLKSGQQIVTTPLPNAISGLRVSVVNVDEEPKTSSKVTVE
tara:strand:- start:40080 stop:41396 length:1317 start_codon:yes stop_codon:yes gene_type:complete